MNFPIIKLLNVTYLIERSSFDLLNRSSTGVGGGEGLELQQHDVDKIVAADKGRNVIVPLLVVEHVVLKLLRTTKDPTHHITLVATERHTHSEIVHQSELGGMRT